MKATFKSRLQLNFFTQKEFEPIEGLTITEQSSIIGRNILRLLMMGWTQSWTQLVTPTILCAIFFKKNNQLLSDFKLAFQQGFYELFDQLKGISSNSTEYEQANLYLSNCLAFLSYANLRSDELIVIPQNVDDQWLLIEYQISCIPLNDEKDFKGIFKGENDRVFAYGLKPILNQNAKSHLIFKGTTYPAGQGFWPQIYSNFIAFETVGMPLYLSGRERIHSWLNKQPNETHVCGISLGGSLGLLLAMDKGNYKLSRVDALNPAGLYAHSKNHFDFWDELSPKPQVVVQRQGSDPVSACGIWKNDWEIILVVAPTEKKGPNKFCDHILNYAGFAEKFIYIDPKKDNLTRHLCNFWIYKVLRSLVYYLLLPLIYVGRPTIFFISTNKLLFLLLFIFIVISKIIFCLK